MNGVLKYSKGSNLVYGTGKEGCDFYYYGLNWDTGELAFKYKLGTKCRKLFNSYDGGNNNILDDHGNIYFSGGGSLLKLEKQN